jgi:putative endonuclease
VYILASIRRILYVGVTRDLESRVVAHRRAISDRSFTAHYRCERLVYFEVFEDVRAAIAREKQIKSWRRSKKIALIESVNADWVDLMPLSSRA